MSHNSLQSSATTCNVQVRGIWWDSLHGNMLKVSLILKSKLPYACLTGGWLWQHPLLLPWLEVPQIRRDRCQIPKQIPSGLLAMPTRPLFTLRSNCSLTRRGSMCTTPCSTYQRSICSPASLISSRRTKTTRSKWPLSI